MTIRERFSRWIQDGKAFCSLFGLLVVPAEEDAAKDRALTNYKVYVALVTAQRDAAQRDREWDRVQLRADLSELCGERDDARAALRVLLAATVQGGCCLACGQPLMLCQPRCARLEAAAVLLPVSGEAVGEA
jgi:hypothetical protein